MLQPGETRLVEQRVGESGTFDDERRRPGPVVSRPLIAPAQQPSVIEQVEPVDRG